MATSFTTNYSGTGISPLGVTTTANGTEIINANIAASTANVPFAAVVFPFASLQNIFMWADGGNLTVKTNNATTPNQTFTLQANVPMVWQTGSPITNPITANLTSGIFVTNAGAANVTFNLIYSSN